MATADRRPRRTRVWWLVVNEGGLAIAVKNFKASAEAHLGAAGYGPEYRVIRVIESPGGRGKRGRKA